MVGGGGQTTKGIKEQPVLLHARTDERIDGVRLNGRGVLARRRFLERGGLGIHWGLHLGTHWYRGDDLRARTWWYGGETIFALPSS